VAADGAGVTEAEGALWHPSPNFGPRRDGLRPELIVIHYTAMATAEAAVDRLCDPAPEGGGPVSCHYVIAEDGRLWQLVREADRAWHAGAGSWRGAADVNSRSIGIELANDGASPFPEPQMWALEALLPGIMARHRIGAAGVIAHSDMAPGRKADPGPRFDWRRLALQGLAIWPEPGRADGGDFARDLAAIGYDGADAEVLLNAFRLRFRPGARGALCAADRAAARALARSAAAGPAGDGT